jgi:hypothetical protein
MNDSIFKPVTAEPASAVQLPLWREALRGMPYAFARSSLFVAGNRSTTNARPYLKQAKLASIGGLEVTYTGEELRQDDADVLLQCYHLAREQPLGTAIEFTAWAMIKALKWSQTASSYERLRGVIIRLKATAVVVKGNLGGYGGSLIHEFIWMDEVNGMPSRTWRIVLNPRLISLFENASYVLTEWDRHLSLGQLAKWLNNFYASHSKPHPILVATLKELSGSKSKTLFHFRAEVRRAFAELKDVVPNLDWEIDDKDRVCIRSGRFSIAKG